MEKEREGANFGGNRKDLARSKDMARPKDIAVTSDSRGFTDFNNSPGFISLLRMPCS